MIATVLASCSSSNKTEQMLVGNWIEVMPVSLDIVEGVTLEKDGKASSIGMHTLLYEKWETKDSKLMLWGKSIGNGQTIDFIDTLSIVSITPDSLILDKFGKYRITYYKVASLDDIKPFNVLDSLKEVAHTEEIETRQYNGVIPNKSCVEIKNELTLYNYKNSGDGVYKMTSTYLRPNNEQATDNSYGRMYTLRGDAQNVDAVVYQLVPFKGDVMTNFLYQGDSLQLLTSDLKLPETKSVFKLQ